MLSAAKIEIKGGNTEFLQKIDLVIFILDSKDLYLFSAFCYPNHHDFDFLKTFF